MKTIELKIYSFSELSEEAQQKAISNYRNNGIYCQYIYDEAHETVKKAGKLFKLNLIGRTIFDFSASHLDNNILELTGLRLRKYLINNFDLYKGKFYAAIGDNRIINHPCIKVHKYDISKGARVSSSNFYYSRIQKENSCILTGVCYDDSFLSPMYNFINDYRNFPSANYQTFEDIIQYCFDSLKKDLESEEEYRNSDEAIKDEIEANEYEFTEDGKIYN
jgi:6-pyruvoyl-tetrahydropterin synthase